MADKRNNKCYKAGRVTKNPFFNFLREYRVKQTGMSITEIASQAGAVWRSMDDKQKEPYLQQATKAPSASHKGSHHKKHSGERKNRDKDSGRKHHERHGGRHHKTHHSGKHHKSKRH